MNPRDPIWMAGLVGVLLIVLLTAYTAESPLPYEFLQDIPQEHTVGSKYLVCNQQDLVATLELHPKDGEWWMLWFTAKGWVMAPFYSQEIPAGGQPPKRYYFGRWDTSGEKTRFILVGVRPYSPETTIRDNCRWLVPEPEA